MHNVFLIARQFQIFQLRNSIGHLLKPVKYRTCPIQKELLMLNCFVLYLLFWWLPLASRGSRHFMRHSEGILSSSDEPSPTHYMLSLAKNGRTCWSSGPEAVYFQFFKQPL